jgi:solute carrier family 25 (mitochondrial thiamine pyrophosphate transporter), member 19
MGWEFPMEKFFCGGFAGSTAIVATYPFDLLRTHLAIAKQIHAGSMLKHSMKTVHSKGIAGLYQGLTPTLVQTFPYMGINFYAYSKLKILIRHEDVPLGLESFFAGAVSGLISKTIVFPLDVLKRVHQIHGIPVSDTVFVNMTEIAAPSLVRTAKNLVMQEGFLALWKGFVPALAKSMVASSVTFYVHETSLSLLSRKR